MSDERVELTNELFFQGVILGYLDEETGMKEDEKEYHASKLSKELTTRLNKFKWDQIF